MDEHNVDGPSKAASGRATSTSPRVTWLAMTGAVGLLLLGVLLGQFWRPTKSLPIVEQPASSSTTGSPLDETASREPDEANRRESDESARREAQARIDSYCAKAREALDAQMTVESQALLKEIADFFTSRRSGVRLFAQEVTTTRMRWNAAISSDGHRDEVHKLYEKHVISADAMKAAIEKSLEDYLVRIRKHEQRLVNDLHAEILALPKLGTVAKLDIDAFRSLIERKAEEVASELTATACTPLIGVFSISAEVLPIFMSLSPTTQIVVAIATIVIPYVIRFVEGLCTSQSEVEVAALGHLDELSELVLRGSKEARSVFGALMKIKTGNKDSKEGAPIQEESSFERVEGLRRRAELLIHKMRNNGSLGIEEVLRLVEERGVEMRSKVLSEIVLP